MAISKVTLNGTTLMDATTATAAAADITAPKTAMLANGVVTTGTGTGSGEEIISNANVLLASGTADAGITSAAVGDGLVDTGLTLGDLRQYKYFYIKIRLDDNKPYLGFRIGNTNYQYKISNAVYMQFTWLDNAKTALMPISCGAGNAGIAGSPDRVANSIYYAMNNFTVSASQWLGAISIGNAADTNKIYVGIANMNGLAETTKSMIWGVFGMGAYS